MLESLINNYLNMFTKTINQKKENDLLANHSLSIPENIKTTINER